MAHFCKAENENRKFLAEGQADMAQSYKTNFAELMGPKPLLLVDQISNLNGDNLRN